jgi:hypothetical protein
MSWSDGYDHILGGTVDDGLDILFCVKDSADADRFWSYGRLGWVEIYAAFGDFKASMPVNSQRQSNVLFEAGPKMELGIEA